ncbi:MAG: isochorismatase family protein [Candidatus Korarchaeota archaeon]|nr:isochorismatase family protein [Candidatus Korarchaeota archaeon]
MFGSNLPGRLDPENTFLLVIDMQESFSKIIVDFDSIVDSITLLARISKLLGMPVVGTEQAPDKLGRTVREVDELLDEKMEKTSFDAFRDERIRERLISLGRRKVLLTGIEAHICVLQTALSATSHGLEVHLVNDATGSTFPEDKEVILARLLREGIHVTTSESAVYELLGSSEHYRFKEVVPLVKEYRSRRWRKMRGE